MRTSASQIVAIPYFGTALTSTQMEQYGLASWIGKTCWFGQAEERPLHRLALVTNGKVGNDRNKEVKL